MTAPSRSGGVRRASSALYRLLRDPDDTSQVFEIVRAFEGPALLRNFARFRETALGREPAPNLARRLADRDALAAMPAGSLGRAYLSFAQRYGLAADGLVEASRPVDYSTFEDPEHQAFAEWLRDQHDLWHVLTGYDPDVVGELSLLAFTWAQTRNPGIALITGTGYLVTTPFMARGPAARATIREGWRRGSEAAWLPGVDWASMLPRPLDEVRRALGVGAPPAYARVWTKELPFTRASALAS
ncbi:MAG: Coq4 family protein [Myxococcota bacterium]